MDSNTHLKIATGASLAAAVAYYLYTAAESNSDDNDAGGKVKCRRYPAIENARDTLEIKLNEQRFLGLMEKLIPAAEFVQNHPPELVPQEGKVVAILMAELKKYENVLKVEEVSYAKGRSNLIITYPGEPGNDKTISLIGSHLDVVPVNREEWSKEPFKMTREGDLIYGRGTTDCLGHCALITDFMCSLAEKKPKLGPSVTAVFIASEENSMIPGVGVDALVKDGRLNKLKNGPVLWIDAADSQPCMVSCTVS